MLRPTLVRAALCAGLVLLGAGCRREELPASPSPVAAVAVPTPLPSPLGGYAFTYYVRLDPDLPYPPYVRIVRITRDE